MKERDCNNCIHQKDKYSKRLQCLVASCDSWECEFEPKNKASKEKPE